MSLYRVQVGTAQSISHRFVPVDQGIRLDIATVRLLRDDGTELTPVPETTRVNPDSDYAFTLTPEHTAQLDRLTAVWTATIDGYVQTVTDTIEIVGDVLFTIAEGAAALGGTPTDADIEDARLYAETALERAIGFALVPRYSRVTLSGSGTTALRLPPYTRTVRWIEVASGAGSVTYDGGELLIGSYMWPVGLNNITVGLEHGLDAGNSLLPGARRQALSLAVDYLGGGSGTVDPRAERLITDDGTIVYGASGAGQFRASGVNEWVTANRLPVIA